LRERSVRVSAPGEGAVEEVAMGSLVRAAKIQGGAVRLPATTHVTRHAPVNRLQTTLSNAAVQHLVESVLRLPGEPLASDIRADMEARFGADFGAVRIHTGSEASDSAVALEANAFTVGQQIVFGNARYAPETASGLGLLAHELAHVVQQSRGGPTPTGEADAAIEAGAEQAASTVASGAELVEVSGASGVGLARQGSADPDPTKRGLYPHRHFFKDSEEYWKASERGNWGPPETVLEGSEPIGVSAIEWLPYPESALAAPTPAPPAPKPAPKPVKPKPAPKTEPPTDIHLLMDILEATRPRLIYPKPVRHIFGGLQFVGGGLEAIGGAFGGIGTAETGIGLVGGIIVVGHGVDVASSGLYTLFTGEESETFTYMAGAGWALSAGADPKMARAIGQSTDIIVGSAGLVIDATGLTEVAPGTIGDELAGRAPQFTPQYRVEIRAGRPTIIFGNDAPSFGYQPQELTFEPLLPLPEGTRASALPQSGGAAALDDPTVFGAPPALAPEDVQSWLKAIRRHGERLTFGRVVPNDPLVRARLLELQAALASGDRTHIGSAFHALHFEFSRELESPEILINRRLNTPGMISDYRLPDFWLQDPAYIPARPLKVWDLKPLNLNEYSFYLSDQFGDIRSVTGESPIPLYYRLPRPRGNIPRGLRRFQRPP
jgi:hypothetical protein